LGASPLPAAARGRAGPPATAAAAAPAPSALPLDRHTLRSLHPSPPQANNDDFNFNLAPALSGAPSPAFSLQSINFPDHFFSVTPGDGASEVLRLGIAVSPAPANATFLAVPGLSDPSKVSLQVASGLLQGMYVTLASGVLSGSCASKYGSPSGDVYLSDGSNKAAATWATTFTPPPPPPIVTIDVTNVTHTINPKFMGCHLDPGESV